LSDRFVVGDIVRIMTYDEAFNEYGENENGNIVFPDGSFDYTDMADSVGGLVGSISEIRDDGEFILDTGDEVLNRRLVRWFVDKSTCYHASSFVVPDSLPEEYLNALTELIMLT